MYLVVGFSLHPIVRRKGPEEKLPEFIIGEDQGREGKGRKPPPELERVHPKTLVHARSVGEEASQSSLKEESKVEDPIGHALLEDRQFPGLANDQVSPLDNDNGNKEGSVTSVLQNLPVLVGPFLAIGVFQIIDGNRVPGLPDAKENSRGESILSHDHKVDKEACRGLNHTDLTIGH